LNVTKLKQLHNILSTKFKYTRLV